VERARGPIDIAEPEDHQAFLESLLGKARAGTIGK
jgi:hypothetical protein